MTQILVDKDEYEHLLRIKQYINNYPKDNIVVCEKCGAYIPSLTKCMECEL